MLYPFKFEPISVERVWGGRRLERYGKQLPADRPIGESWEISDRDDATSCIINGPHAGQSLREIIQRNHAEILGTNVRAEPTTAPRFPLLIKLLDARERLSLQVHPPSTIAARFSGEPKTEMWYVLEADPQAHLIAGLRSGVTRAQLMTALRNNTVEQCIYRFPVTAGDAIFIPSGRLHAIDAGLVIVEIQQNSDTTFRVSDWDRLGLDGRPRKLHFDESMASIDFDDDEPRLLKPVAEEIDGDGLWRLVECPEFHVHKITLCNSWRDRTDGSTFHVLGCIGGRVGIVLADGTETILNVGEFALIPAQMGYYRLTPSADNAAALKAYVPPPSANDRI